ncbi:MAG: DUF2339 domain-containing protein [Elusimicrobia bacterium]|nr:DUF2339 domain-containing protein [Elusimicrobiota bacterium]
MKCPKCSAILTGPAAACGHCGFTFTPDFRSRLELYLELKGDLDRLRSVVRNDLAAGIERLSIKIERNYAANEEPAAPAPAPAPVKFEAAKPAVITAAPPPAPKITKEEKQRADLNFETAMGQKWLLIIGIVATVFGVGYFLKYSFDQGWVGPAGRVALAYLWGAAFLFGGNMFRKRNLENFGLYLSGGGIATLYFATFAAYQIYNLIGQAPSFLLMVMVTALAGLLAVLYDAKWLAVLGMIGGFLTPVLLGTGVDNQLVLMSYMTILNLGLLGVAFYKKWDLLTVLGFLFTYLLYAGWYAQYYRPEKFWPALIFVTIFYLIYTVMPFITRFVQKEPIAGKGFSIIIPNSFIAFGFSYYMVKEHFSLEAVGVISVFYAAVFLYMASYAYKAGKQNTEGFVVLAGKAMLFLIVTVPLIFSRHWITVFWSAQAMALLWMGARLNNKHLSRSALALFSITAIKLFFYDYPEVFGLNDSLRLYPDYWNMFAERWITAAIFFILFYCGADLARRKKLALLGQSETHPYLYALFGALFFLFLNIETSAFFYDVLPAARFAAISVLWALFSVGMIVAGFRTFSAPLRKTALALFMVTVVKVFLFDMSKFSTPYRIFSFMILGLLLVGTSLIYHKYKNKLVPAEPAKEGEKA